ncbi:hypothetical protein [Anaerotruncus colihominis]|uniref:hypothetical protein n=1 Tax=Anaerotruncus colihominis TaxID=169435 RepID=UPI0034A0F918
MKKVICCLTSIMLIGFAGCANDTNQTHEETSSSNYGQVTTQSSEIAASGSLEAQEPAQTSQESGEVIINEQVLVDENGIKITATGFDEGGIFGPGIKLLIENNTDTDLTVQARNASVNGYMIDTSISAEVVAGKKANDTIDFMESDLETCGITTLADFEFSFHIFSTDDWQEYLDTPIVQVKNASVDSYNYEYDDTGTLLYEGEGIRIISKGMAEEGSFLGPNLKLFIENLSQQGITVQARDVSVNGFMVDTSLSAEVLPNKRANTELTLIESDLEENGIAAVNEIELSFHIFESESWNDIIDTEKITITF